MSFKCPKCGSLNTTVTDYDTLDKNLSPEQKKVLLCKKMMKIKPDDWVKIILAIITAAGAIIGKVIDWMAKKDTKPKNYYIVCKDCHTVSKLDDKTYQDAR